MAERAGTHGFVPDGFEPPAALDVGPFKLRPLGPEHNAADHAAWSSSIDRIRATPGFEGRDWPRAMSPEQNLDDLRMHAADFAARDGFTYTVLGHDDDVIGCVYIYPDEDPAYEAQVRSWVRADHAHLDRALVDVIRQWLRDAWPFASVRYR